MADESNSGIHTLGRRAAAPAHPRLISHIVDFARLPALPRADEVYIALGTTIKVAGSQQAFRAVDLDAVLAVAKAAHASGARRLGVVSAMGADAASSVFYNRTKGEMEQALTAIGFDTLVIARPSLLVGDRGTLGQPTRPGEQAGLWVSRILRPLIPANYLPIEAAHVARSLIGRVRQARPGTQILLSGAMQPAG